MNINCLLNLSCANGAHNATISYNQRTFTKFYEIRIKEHVPKSSKLVLTT